jgi:hypothetical protein
MEKSKEGPACFHSRDNIDDHFYVVATAMLDVNREGEWWRLPARWWLWWEIGEEEAPGMMVSGDFRQVKEKGIYETPLAAVIKEKVLGFKNFSVLVLVVY